MNVVHRARLWLTTPALLVAFVGILTIAASPGSFTIQAALAGALISMLMVIALSIFTGGSGVFSFGHVAFMAIGAYGTGLLSSSTMSKQIQLRGLPIWLEETQLSPVVAILLSSLLAALVAFVVSLPLMRLNGLSAGLATLALLMVVRVVLQNWDSYTNGTSGLIVDGGSPTISILFAWVVGGILLAWTFARSRHGMRLVASREDEPAARAAGIEVYRERVLAFTVSAFIAGVSGGLFALYFQSIHPDSFFLTATLTVIAMLVIGGAESLSGAVVGTIILASVLEGIRQVEDAVSRPGISEAGLSLALLLILFLRPSGVTGGKELRLPSRFGSICSPNSSSGQRRLDATGRDRPFEEIGEPVRSPGE